MSGVLERPRVVAPRAALALTGLLSVSALLAWCFRLGPFWLWFLLCSLPSSLLLLALGWWVRDRTSSATLRLALVAGASGGLLGTLGYDLFRVPFVASGLRVLAPIDSYGILALGASHSSGWTGLVGWGYHFANGIGFGIAYAMVALGRHWGWAVGWAMVLETATVLTPFFSLYGLAGQPGLVAVAYAAHVCYGVPLGLVVQRAAGWDWRTPQAVPVSVQLGLLASVLVVWHHPWSARAAPTDPRGPAVAVEAGRFVPEWVRVATSGCVVLVNRDAVDYRLPGSGAFLAAGSRLALCRQAAGVRRLRLSPAPYSGGFVIWDPEER